MRKLAAVLIPVAVVAAAGSGARQSSAAAACVPAPIHHGAPPRWTASAWSSSPGFRIPYSLASGAKAAAFFFAPTLRAGHPTNPTNKILWIVRLPRDGSPLRITARSATRTVRATWPADSSPGQIYPSYVDLPTPGCWVITLGWHGHHATIDLQVHPRASPAAVRCPVSRARPSTAFVGPGLGSGPVYTVLGGRTLMLRPFARSTWRSGKMAWVATGRYRGPIVIHGRRLDETADVRFGGGRLPAGELRLSGPGAGVVGAPRDWRVWPSLTRLRASGCYEFDVTGASLHERIVFRGAVAPTPGRRPL